MYVQWFGKNRGMVNFIAQTIRSFIIADSLFRIDSSVFVVGQKKKLSSAYRANALY
jgi:hypothetical protein